MGEDTLEESFGTEGGRRRRSSVGAHMGERESFGREERKERKKEGPSGPTGIERRVLVLLVP
jgi:hypothetical protein